MRVGTWLFALFVTVPIIEIVLFIVVGGWIGIWPTLLIVVLTAVIGSAMVSRQGRGAWRQLQAEIARGESPSRTLVHGAMILVAGALLLTPGFLTDLVGFLLLIPAFREALRSWFIAKLRARWVVVP
ncbi:MAG: FxsA family protein [Acidimicrobiia bacterium]